MAENSAQGPTLPMREASKGSEIDKAIVDAKTINERKEKDEGK